MAINTNMSSMKPRREHYKRVVRLVSGGFYNRKAFPNGEVTVFPWDSHVDGWFTDRVKQPDKEYTLWEAAAKVADLNGCRVEDMLLGDIMTILMVAKSIRNNCVVDYVATCPSCNKREPCAIRIPDELQINAKKELDFQGQETLTLPDCKDVVIVRLLSIQDEKDILNRTPDDRQRLSDHIAHILLPIVTIGGGRPENLDEALLWYDALSPRDVDFLEKEQAKLYPQLDLALKQRCEVCKCEFSYTLDLNQDFFRAGER